MRDLTENEYFEFEAFDIINKFLRFVCGFQYLIDEKGQSCGNCYIWGSSRCKWYLRRSNIYCNACHEWAYGDYKILKPSNLAFIKLKKSFAQLAQLLLVPDFNFDWLVIEKFIESF